MKFISASLVCYLILICGSFAGPSKAKHLEVSRVIELEKTLNGEMTSFVFKVNGTPIYRLFCKNNIIVLRTSFERPGAYSDLRITEYDLNVDGELDAIQIGTNDDDFSPFLVIIKDGKLDITPLPENWINGSKYPFDAFINFVKAQKGIEP